MEASGLSKSVSSLGIRRSNGKLLRLSCPDRCRRTLRGIDNTSILRRDILRLHGLLDNNRRSIELSLLDGLVPDSVVASVSSNDAEGEERTKVAEEDEPGEVGEGLDSRDFTAKGVVHRASSTAPTSREDTQLRCRSSS